jgi:hypothetical protein
LPLCSVVRQKPQKEIQAEIAAIIRQITASCVASVFCCLATMTIEKGWSCVCAVQGHVLAAAGRAVLL